MLREVRCGFFYDVELHPGLGQFRSQARQLHLLGRHRLGTGSAQPAFPMRFEPVMQGWSGRPRIAAVAAMLWPAPTSLTASSLNSSVYRARFVFTITPPMNKIMHLLWDPLSEGKVNHVGMLNASGSDLPGFFGPP